MTAPLDPLAEPAAASALTGEDRNHFMELRRSTAALRRRVTAGDTARWLLLSGAVLVPLGFLLIVAGYWGAAHAPRVIQQIPYELSGGVLGTALVFVGGFSYFGYWLTQILREQQKAAGRLDAQTAALVQELRALRSALAGPAGEPASDEPELVATPGGSLAHLPTCPIVAGRVDTRPAPANGSRPCKICQPVSEPDRAIQADHVGRFRS